MIWKNRPAIVLVGPMGAGKSTVGKSLAELLKWDFVDTDRELEARCGADIPWIFDIEGEEGFRRREIDVVSELMNCRDTVVATGGGAILAPENRSTIRRASAVIYLTASLESLFARVAKDTSRPLLQVENPKATYEKIYRQRDPLYREVADHVIVTDDKGSPASTANTILQKLGVTS